MSWLSRIVNVFRSAEVNEELDEELRFHVEARAEDLIAAGVPRDDALREASRRLGNTGVLRERSRDVRLLAWMDALVRDLSFGARMLRRDAVVSAAAIASLALAIGACTAAFALVDALILRPLPVREPSRLVSLAIVEDPARRDRTSFNYPLYQRLGEATRGRVELAAFSHQARSDAAIDRRGAEEHVYAQFASGNAFGLLGVTPALGRVLVPSDDKPGAAHDVAVLSHSFWMARFGGDPAVVGRRLRLERNTYEIVGVARKGFTGVEPGIRTDFWVPLTSTATPESLTDPGWHWFKVLGRLEPGHSAGEVRDVMQSVLSNFRKEEAAARWRPGMPTEGRDRYLRAPMVLRPAWNGLSDLRTDFARPLWILSAVVGLVLLLACSNLANLMLARAAARSREMALRLSIGAGRGRLVQQMLVEAAAISVAAVALGTLFAWIAAPAIVTLLAPADAPAYLDLHFDWRVLGFVAALGILATVTFGLVPAVRASSTSPVNALKVAGGRSSTRVVLVRPLVAVQTAVGLAVLVVAGVLLLSFNRLVHVDAGFEPEGVTLVSVELVNPDEGARGRDAAQTLLDQVRAAAGVTAAGLSKWPIMSGAGWTGWVRIPGRRPDDTEVYFLEVTRGFLDAMRMRLLAGRDLTRRDVDADAEGPVLVNETFARMYFPGVSPVGSRFERPEGNRSGGGREVPHEIVGIVADTKYNDLREAAPPMVYMPLRGPRPGDDMTLKSGTLEIRTSLPDEAVAGVVRAAAARVSPPMKVTNVTKQSTLVTNTMLRERLLALLSAFFALVSLALAGVGLYGVLSYSVVRQTREIGIRMALGATWRLIVGGVLGGIAAYVAVGLVTGLGAGLWLARFLSKLLYEVRPGDTATILLPLGLLLLVVLPAALLPARRAATVDPVVALRDE
jgi:predicted permease